MHKVWGVSGSVELCAKRVESTESEAAGNNRGFIVFLWDECPT